MKFNKLASINVNSANNQISFILKAKQLKRIGITPEELLKLQIPMPKTKFYKKQKEVKK
jgi:hypothetical protein